MKTIDVAGQSLTFELTFGMMRRIQSQTGLDLLRPHEPVDSPADRPLQKLLEDTGVLYDVLEAIATRQEWKPEAIEAVTASELGAFFEALIEAWVDFFRQAGQPAKAELILQHLDVMTKAAETYQATLKTSNLTEVMQQKVREEMEGMIEAVRQAKI